MNVYCQILVMALSRGQKLAVASKLKNEEKLSALSYAQRWVKSSASFHKVYFVYLLLMMCPVILCTF